MVQKIIVADDSVTIQKVVKITLANDPVELIECLDEKSLFEKLNEGNIDLVLLDFNLTQGKKGYDLAKEIHEASPNTSIMVLLGTFDTIDENQMGPSFIEDKVIKPFESKEFITKVRSILSTKEQIEDPSDEENWVVDAPDIQEIEELPVFETDNIPDVLSEEISGWGIEVPGVIGNEEVAGPKEVPPVLDPLEIKQEIPKYEPPKEMEQTLEQAVDEDMASEDFWSIDEDETPTETITFEEKSEIKKEIPAPEISMSFEQELKDKITPIIEDLVKKYCEQTIQKVAWEVIPDLAENLIKKELQEISRSIE